MLFGSVSDCMKMNLKVQSVELRYDLSEHFWGYEQFATCAIFRIAIGLQKCSGVDFKNTIQPNLYGSRLSPSVKPLTRLNLLEI